MTLRTAFGPFGPAISVAAFCAIFGAVPALAAEAEADGEAVVAKAEAEAVAAIMADRADLYLVDLGLPDGDGVELIHLIAEKCSNKDYGHKNDNIYFTIGCCN